MSQTVGSVRTTTAKRAIRLAAGYRGLIVGCMAALVLRGACGLLTPLVIRELIDHSIPHGAQSDVLLLSAMIVGVSLLDGGFGVLQRWLATLVGESLVRDLRARLYTSFQAQSMSALASTKVGDSISRLNNDVMGAQHLVMLFAGTITTTGLAIATFVTMASLEWRLALVSLAIVPPLVMSVRFIGRYQARLTRRHLEATAALNAMTADTLTIAAALALRLNDRCGAESTRFRCLADRITSAAVRRAVASALFFGLIGVIGSVGAGLIFAVGGLLVRQGTATVGTLVAFISYLTMLYALLRELGGAPIDGASSLAALDRVFEILDRNSSAARECGSTHIVAARGELACRAVSYSYDSPADQLLNGTPSGTRTLAIDNVSFSVKQGGMLAIVGPSGAGKTTLAYLLARLSDPSSGTILLDGHDLKDLTQSSLNDSIALVPQDPHIFHDTVRANLLVANPSASPTEIEDAARAAGLHFRIMSLPKQYDTVLGERGYRLSGGERQRLALACAFLRRPAVLILDEPTNQLDSVSEEWVCATIRTRPPDRTCIVISHRPALVAMADGVIVLEQGRVVQQGAHSTLLSARGSYRNLFATMVNGCVGARDEWATDDSASPVDMPLV